MDASDEGSPEIEKPAALEKPVVGDTSSAGGNSGADESRPRSRRRRWIVIGAVGVLAILGVAMAIVFWGGSSGRQVTTREVAPRIGSATSLAPQRNVLRPAQGVYLYRGSGTDSLSAPPKEQVQGPDMPATVIHRADGCWSMRIDYHSNHWQRWDYCPRDGGLDEIGGATYQKWDFGVFVSETTSNFECESSVTVRAMQKPGDEWTQTCRGAGGPADEASLTTGPYRFVGPEDLVIGGETVSALHFHRDRTMSGGQRGTERAEVWFSASTGMPLRNERVLDVKTDSIIGEVNYIEDANFELTSLEPTG